MGIFKKGTLETNQPVPVKVVEPISYDPAPWLAIARAELGQKEVPGSGDNPRIVQYLAATRLPNSYFHDSTAWCAAFVSWVLVEAGYESLHNAWAAAWASYGLPQPTPRYGAVCVLQGHVGFYVGETATHVKILGGNQGHAVTEANFLKAQVVCYRWPVKKG